MPRERSRIMGATLVHAGRTVDYTPGTAKTAGDVVVQGNLVGVCNVDIAANALGALSVEGVFNFPKAAGGSTAIAVGVPVYWDVAEGVAKADDESGANKLIGKTVLAAVDADTTVRVKLDQ